MLTMPTEPAPSAIALSKSDFPTVDWTGTSTVCIRDDNRYLEVESGLYKRRAACMKRNVAQSGAFRD